MIKAVIFDLDDTLISEKEYVISGFKTVCKKISLDHSLNYQILFDRIINLFEESSKEVFNRVLKSLGVEYTEEYILELIKTYREHTPEIKFFDDVIPTITILRERGYKLGIITDGYKETQLKKIEVLKCRELFDKIIITDELGREFWKPHEKAYKLMAKALRLNFNEMIYVGDNVVKDFVTANKLGIYTIQIIRKLNIYKDLEGEEKFRANSIINNVSELEHLNKILVWGE